MAGTPSEMFLCDDDMALLTGYKRKALQVQQLRRMGIPFFVNAAGQPIVAKAVVEGRKDTAPKVPTWEPDWSKLK